MEMSGLLEGRLSCIPCACVWARGSGFRAVGPPPLSLSLPSSLPAPLLRQRQAKGGGGATELTISRRRVYGGLSVCKLLRQKHRGGSEDISPAHGYFPLSSKVPAEREKNSRGGEQRRRR
ncbi:nuclease HARBI1 [Sarotherodon galilaeus]